MIDAVKEYLAPKRFGLVAYICLIVHILGGLTFTAVTSSLRTGEFGKFSCAVDAKSTAAYKTYVEKTCFAKYEQTYNSPLPLYGFVLLSIGFTVLVSIVYSLAVSSRVEEVDRISDGNDEPRIEGEEASHGFCVFYFYFFHLVSRSLFGILFTILQHTVFYPGGFDFEFSCSLPTTDASSQINTATGTTRVLNSSSIITCENSTGSEKRLWGIILSLLNTFVALIIFAEAVYLWRRFPVLNYRSQVGWSCDTEFITDYFLRKRFSRQDGLPLRLLQDSIDFYKQQILNSPRTPDELYIDVVVNTGRAEHKFSKYMDRHEMYDVYMKVPKHSILLENITDLFHPKEDTKDNFPRTILAVGRPGIGKTVLTEKITRDWAKGVDGFYDGKIAFFFKFRWFNSIDDFKNISLKTFLRYGTGMNEEQFKLIFEEISKNPEKAIFIFDGLDEYDGDFVKCLDQLRMLPNDTNTCMSAMDLFLKLVFGNILKGATVLVTSRPTANYFYSKLDFDRSVEMIGFTSDKIEEYVSRFCDNNNCSDLRPKIWNHITSSSDLLNLCYIPVNCFIVCVTLSGCLSDPSNDTGNLPTTLTKLYKTSIDNFGQHHDRNLEQTSSEQTVKNLQKLAFHGIKSGQLVFDRQLLDEQMKKSGLVNSLSNPIFPLQTQFCFIHLTIQEFLAARHVIETLPPDEIKNFISAHIKSGKWHLVLQFIGGLLGEKIKMFESDYQDCVLAFARSLIVQDGEINLRNYDHMLIMKCLREVDDEDIVKQACDIPELNLITGITNDEFSPSASDLAAVTFVCKHLNNLNHLEYGRAMREDNCLQEVGKLLQQRCFERLVLINTYSYVNSNLVKEDLISALVNSKCKLNHKHAKLSHLRLTIEITDECVPMLCRFIKNGHASRLRVLNLRTNELTSSGISRLGEVLNDELCKKLTHLDLSHNNIGDEGVLKLCCALMRGHCKINTLVLDDCSLTSKCLYNLCEVLCDEHCELTNLSLSHNDIDDGEDVLYTLCTDALKSERCKLTILSLNRCRLNDYCAPLLCETLRDRNCRLTKLFLGYNNFSEKGKGLLCDVTKTESCKTRGLEIFYESKLQIFC